MTTQTKQRLQLVATNVGSAVALTIAALVVAEGIILYKMLTDPGVVIGILHIVHAN